MSRRTFLAAGTGLVLAAACGDGGDRGGGKATTTAGAQGGATGSTVLVRFFSDGVQAAGLAQRLTFGLGNADGVLATGGPDELVFTVVDDAGRVVTEQTVARHAEGLPRPYWPLRLQIAEPGLYTAKVNLDDGEATAAFSVTPPGEILVPKPGDRLVAVDTPTTADARGVTPICTRDPACPLHDITLTAAMAEKVPIALLIGTPAYCQTGTCGPVLDILLAQRQQFPAVRMVHAEIYVDPQKALSSADTTVQGASLGATTEAVNAYQLPFEPALFLARSDGTITERLDIIYDGAELRAAMAALS